MERVELVVPKGWRGLLRFFLRDLPSAIGQMRRAARERGCGQKIRHQTVEAALSHAARLNRRDNGLTFEPYRCRYCSSWHVGRTVDSPREEVVK